MATPQMKGSIASKSVQELLAPLRDLADHAGLLLDIDGTIAPIVAKPEDASVPTPMRELLINLQGRYALVACLSGRRAADARRVVGIGSLDYIGNHGLERLRPGASQVEKPPSLDSHRAAVQAFAADAYTLDLRRAGVRLEDKDSIWSFHWREADDDVSARAALEDVAAAARGKGLVSHWGRKVLEIRPPLTFDKGTASEALVEEADLDAALYAGDDTTDLDVFRTLRELRADGTIKHVVCVGVTSDEGPPEIAAKADLTVEGPSGVRELLTALV